MSDASVPVHKEQGGAELDVASGGKIDVESGGILEVDDGGVFRVDGTQVNASGADLNKTIGMANSGLSAPASGKQVSAAQVTGTGAVAGADIGIDNTLTLAAVVASIQLASPPASGAGNPFTVAADPNAASGYLIDLTFFDEAGVIATNAGSAYAVGYAG